jgi:hypothetical protein
MESTKGEEMVEISGVQEPDVVAQIFRHLVEPQDVLSAAQVCRYVYSNNVYSDFVTLLFFHILNSHPCQLLMSTSHGNESSKS